MASKRNRRRKSSTQTQTNQSTQSNDASNNEIFEVTIDQAVLDISSVARASANEDDIAAIGDIDIPSDISPEDFKTMYAKTAEAYKLFNIQNEGLKQIQEDLDEQLKSLQEQISENEKKAKNLIADEESLRKEQEELIIKKEEITEKEQEIAEKSINLDLREKNAKSGFLNQYKEIEETANNQIAEVQDRLSELFSEISQQRQKASEDLLAELSQLREQEENRWKDFRKQEEKYFQEQRKSLDKEWLEITETKKTLETEKANIHRLRQELEVDQEIIKEDRDSLDQLVQKLVDRDHQLLKDRLDWYDKELKRTKAEREQFKSSLTAWDHLERTIGKDPQTLIDHNNKLTKERDELANQLANRPDESELQRLNELVRQKQEWEDERFLMVSELEELKIKIQKSRVGLIEVENLRDEKLALEASRDYLRQAVTDLRQDIEGRLAENVDLSPFPQCYSLDFDDKMQNALFTEDVENLKEFVGDIRMRIANEGLYYEERDIRSFIGGLAMSPMMILQGISGTGKTSLPIEFARAVGGECEVIEVQAGWRDRDDLVGYYNAFEKKFHEKKFLQALYKAGCPVNRDLLYIILLDEMNLSYVEQYFADFLSVLQMRRREDWKIDLIPATIPNRKYPSLLVNNNRSIPIPNNIRFIGTFNQDETTKDIADKTYDRSHIIELPEKHPGFDLQPPQASPPRISYSSIQKAFEKAKQNKTYINEIKKAWEFLDLLRPTFSENLGVGWGNRLQGQLQDYLPVIRACGGTWAEGVDDILAMKILRKLRDRYELRATDFETLKEDMESAWETYEKKNSLTSGLMRSVRIIETELNKKTGLPEDLGL